MNVSKTLKHLVKTYNQPAFIEQDPISVPHQFHKQADIEIAGFFAAIFAWGLRKIILNKCHELMEHMDYAPHDFIRTHTNQDLKKLIGFKHRTFNDTDLLYTIHFLHHHYQHNQTLETAFTQYLPKNAPTIEAALIGFKTYFFSLPDFPMRTQKHISSPESHSACKRLNMYLRWMVRSDKSGVDFGLWKSIQSAQLVCPLDVHSGRMARHFGLLTRTQNDWQAALELTESLKKLDAKDPVQFDFALFGAGVNHSLI